ncbi:uncharacterized protein [Diabrotica undecimpunctata]|uniref:uncharacterized protein n=1 Tax=Diabrotica undecimpunctata TaxID=50387 RepID=UPI003B6372C4
MMKKSEENVAWCFYLQRRNTLRSTWPPIRTNEEPLHCVSDKSFNLPFDISTSVEEPHSTSNGSIKKYRYILSLLFAIIVGIAFVTLWHKTGLHKRSNFSEVVPLYAQALTMTNKAVPEDTQPLTMTNKAVPQDTQALAMTNKAVPQDTQPLTMTNKAVPQDTQI